MTTATHRQVRLSSRVFVRANRVRRIILGDRDVRGRESWRRRERLFDAYDRLMLFYVRELDREMRAEVEAIVRGAQG